MDEELVEIFTDGACRGNPGPGGWAALLRCKGKAKTISGGEARTTNNRMEMIAAIKALEALTQPCKVRLTTDSQYLMKGMTEWLKNWKRRGWVTASKTPVKNVELWKRLDALTLQHQVEWEWVRGHNSHEENELVDSLARQALKQHAG